MTTETKNAATEAPQRRRRSKEEIELDRAEAVLERMKRQNEAIDRLVAASKAHREASEAARASPLDQKLLATWSASLIEVEAASLALARYCIAKES